MAQQTAVEWLYNKLSTCTSDEMVGNINNWFEQAKQMEREQREQLFNQSIKDIKSYVKSLNTENNKIYKDNEILIMSCFSSAMEIIESTFNK